MQSLSHVWLFVTSMNCSTPGFQVLHYLQESAQTPVRWVSDAIQPSHPLSLPSPPAFNISQHQGLFQWSVLCPSIGVSASASVLSMNIQDWFPLGLIGLILLFKGHSRVFLSTTVQKQILWCLVLVFFIFQLSYLHANWKNHSFDYMYLCWLNDVSAF